MIWLKWSAIFLGLLVVALLVTGTFGSSRWQKSSEMLLTKLSANRLPAAVTRFDMAELQDLPAPVQRYFRAVLKDGQPIIATASIKMAGTMNMSTTAEQWKRFSSTQNVVTFRPGFVWDAKVNIYPAVPAHVVDSYIAGQGLLNAKLLGLFTVADVQGGGELARGEFMRWFAESPWYPTALLPSRGVRWQAVDDSSANASIADGTLTMTLLFRFDESGLITSVRAEARGAGTGKEMVMLPWECQFSDYQLQHGMMIPMAGEAAYVRPEGLRPYFMGQVERLEYTFAP